MSLKESIEKSVRIIFDDLITRPNKPYPFPRDRSIQTNFEQYLVDTLCNIHQGLNRRTPLEPESLKRFVQDVTRYFTNIGILKNPERIYRPYKLAEIISEHAESLLSGRMKLSAAIRNYEAEQKKIGPLTKQFLALNEQNPPAVFAPLENGYSLCELKAIAHLVAEGNEAEHCIGSNFNRRAMRQNGIRGEESFQYLRYWQHMQSGALRVFSVRTPKGQTVYTISYNPLTGVIPEMEEAGYRKKYPHIRYCVYDPEGTHIAALYKALGAIDQDLGIVSMKHAVRVEYGKTLTKDGYKNPKDVALDDVIAGRVIITNDDSAESIERVCLKKDIVADITNLTELHRLPTRILASLMSKRKGIISIPHLIEVDELDCQGCKQLQIPNLATHGGIVTSNLCIVTMPAPV